MILVEVNQQNYSIAEEYLTGSKLIMGLLSDLGSDTNTTIIPLGVNSDDWKAYLRFLTSRDAAIGALRVINYLDHIQQAREWCQRQHCVISSDIVAGHHDRCRTRHTSRRNIKVNHDKDDDGDGKDTNSNDTNVDGHNTELSVTTSATDSSTSTTVDKHVSRRLRVEKTKFMILSKFVADNTAYDPAEVLPVQCLVDFRMVLKRIKSVGRQSIDANEIRAIACRYLFHTFKDHSVIITTAKLAEIPENSMKSLLRNKFILVSADGSVTKYYSDVILGCFGSHYMIGSADRYRCHLFNNISYISARVAEFYPEITAWTLEGCKGGIICPTDKPYPWVLRVKQAWHIWCEEIPAFGLDDTQIYCGYKPNSSYHPHEGFQTGVKLADTGYTVVTYNYPSLYDRDYYVFAPHEYDPIAKVVYAFSV